MNVKKVLVFPCGSEIGLEIYRSLKYEKNIELWGASSVDSNHGKFVFHNYIGNIPFIDDASFIVEFNKVLKKNLIDYIYPALDDVAVELSKNEKNLFSKVIGSDYETNLICRSKSKTYKYFMGKLRVPKMYNPGEKVTTFPIFLKPDAGQGSKGTYFVKTNEELLFYTKDEKELLILEYLPGKEYTIDCFTDFKGELKFVGGRDRIRVRNGISVNSMPVDNIEFFKIAHVINDNLTLNGVWFYQLKENFKGELVLLEIAPRISGTMALYRNKGINIPLLGLYNSMKIETEIIKNSFDIEIDRALYNRFKTSLNYKTVYVDFDDCLIINDKINTSLIYFLFQCVSDGKKIVLLSKHERNLKMKLKQYKIYEIFDLIINIKKDACKTDYITEKDSIFIDDSFSERYHVFQKFNIPVFAPDAIESLIK